MELFLQACGAVGPLAVTVGRADGRPTEHREFAQPFLVLGRDPKAGLPLADAGVSNRHAYLQVIGGNVFGLDLFSRGGLRWGDSPRAAGWIEPDQPLGVGPFTVRVPNASTALHNDLADPIASRPASHDPLPSINLEILLDNQTVVWPMNRVLALVGRDPRCKVNFKADGVSSVHCSLVRTPLGLWVVDLASSTGTTVNGHPVKWALLDDGDELGVGEMRIRVIHPAKRVASPPAPSAEESLRLQLGELTRSLAAAEEDRAGLIRIHDEAAARWEAERQALVRQHEAETKAREAERAKLAAEAETLRTASATQRAGLEAEFHTERQTFQNRIATLLGEATTLEKRHQDHVARADGSLERERRTLREEAQRHRAAAAERERERDAAEAALIALRADVATRDQQDRELTAVRDELEKVRAAAQQEATARNQAVANSTELARQIAELQTEVATLRQECETQRSQLAERRPDTPDPALASLTEQFRLAVDRYTSLVDQMDQLYTQLRDRAQQRIEAQRKGMIGRLLGSPREEREETDTAIERRLTAIRADAAIEQERAAFAEAEAARADLARQLAEARRQLAAR